MHKNRDLYKSCHKNRENRDLYKSHRKIHENRDSCRSFNRNFDVFFRCFHDFDNFFDVISINRDLYDHDFFILFNTS